MGFVAFTYSYLIKTYIASDQENINLPGEYGDPNRRVSFLRIG